MKKKRALIWPALISVNQDSENLEDVYIKELNLVLLDNNLVRCLKPQLYSCFTVIIFESFYWNFNF